MDYSKINYDDYFIWHDKDIRFDVAKVQLALRVGEKIIESMDNIEDTKGCNGDIGTMLLTNLRLIWFCNSNVKINLSIGYECVLNFEIKQTSSKVIGETIALYLKCRFNNNRFEFVFNSLTNTEKIFNAFKDIYKAYDSSRLYREMKLKGFLTQDKNLINLPEEQIITKLSAVANIQNDQNISGIFYITNVRICWFSTSIDNYNLSLPWILIKHIKIRDHVKFGKCFIFETNKQTGGCIITLKFNTCTTADQNESLIKQLTSTHIKYLENPLLGVDFSKLESFKNDINSINNQIPSNSSNKNSASIAPENENSSNNSGNMNANANNNFAINSQTKLSVITEINESKLEYSVIETNKNLESNFNSGKPNYNNTSVVNNILDNKTEEYKKMLFNNLNDEVEIIHTNYFNEQPTMLHYMTSTQEKKNTINDIVYCPELGISIEKLPDGVTIDGLWKIILN